MNEQDYAALLRHLRLSTQRSGLGAFDGRAMERVNLEIGTPTRFKVLQYLDALYEEISLNSSDAVTRTLANLNQQINDSEREGGGGVDLFVLELAAGDTTADGENEVQLTGTPELTEVLRQINALREMIADDGDDDPPSLKILA